MKNRHWGCLLLLMLLSAGAAAQTPVSEKNPFAEDFLLLQLSDAEPAKQQQVLNVAANLIEHYGPDRIDIEINTFGPGVRLLYQDNEHREMINSLAAQGVRFMVCMNTINTIERTTGSAPDLNVDAIPVDVGVAHILERVKEGYTLVRP